METKYFKLCYSLNGVQKKLLNPTYIHCPKELAEKYGQALTICNELQGGHGNKFWFEEVKPTVKPSCLTTKQVFDEIYYEFDRAYAYKASKEEAVDVDAYERMGVCEANKLIGQKLWKEINDFINEENQQMIR